ncbi:MAG TPA: alpha/beta fold hydrolase [Acidimicrobiales bacterium]|nr:alpha/beta fold hydrolase [Acidimicrobiales bacterium]
MPKPQQPELRRSERGATDSDGAKSGPGLAAPPPTSDAPGPVPEDNRPGHHPDREQDKPVARYRRRAARAADQARRQLAPGEIEIDAGGMTFSALEAGRQGDDLVLVLHGFPQTAEAWRPQLEGLAGDGYHVVAPNQRGYSPGARPTGLHNYRLDCLVDDVLQIADRLDARRFHLVGHDWGGVVAWATAARQPQRLRSLTVVSTPHPRAYASALLRSPQLLRSGYMGFFALPFVPEALLGAGGGAPLRRLLTRSGLPADWAARYVDEIVERGALHSALNWYRALPLAGTPVGKVDVPTLYVWSDGDVALGEAAARATASQVRGQYRFEVLEGVSHWIPETRPDELRRLIGEHLHANGATALVAAGQ